MTIPERVTACPLLWYMTDSSARSEDQVATTAWSATRASVIRNAIGIGIATGAYGISYGAIAVTTGLTSLQTSALSLLMFTGASQFAFLGVIAAHGSPLAGAATAILLGTRNALYGLRLAPLLRVSRLRRPLAAHLVIDETTAMAIAPESQRTGRLGFWATGASVYLCWNLGSLIGAIGAKALASPTALGLDAAVPAAFLALLAPRIRSRNALLVALTGALIAVIAVPFVPAGVPVLLAAATAAAIGFRWSQSWQPVPSETTP